MTFKEKMKSLEDHVCNYCFYNSCDDCEFFEPEDDTDGNYFCGIRDREGKIPWFNGWKVEEALGIQEPYKPVFPEIVEESMMKHFTKVE